MCGRESSETTAGIKQALLTVYNVKQGDSMLLAGMSGTTCCFDKEPLLIDCGLAKATVHLKIGATPKGIRVLVTHADRDHIGGLFDVLAYHQVSRLYIPRYLPEILRIEDYLRRKAARKHPRLPSVGAARRIEVAEGDHLCSHALVTNPPKQASSALAAIGVKSFSQTALIEAIETLRTRGLDLEAADILGYNPEPIDETDRDRAREGRLAPMSRFRERRKFFQGFFVYLALRLQGAVDTRPVDLDERDDFEPTGDPDTDRVISTALQLASNQVSIVFRYVGTTRFLFTGDADTSVFNRIMSRGHALQAEYLKVPHHGSRHNLDANSLAAISPKVAMVSHGNGKFGRDPDSHPHMDTINLLDAQHVTTYYTNDVLKAGKIIKTATAGQTPCKYLEFK